MFSFFRVQNWFQNDYRVINELYLCFLYRVWDTYTPKASFTRIWNQRMCSMTPIRWLSQTLACLGCLGLCKNSGRSSELWCNESVPLIIHSNCFNYGCACVFRRKNELRIPRGWIYYLAPEIVRKMSPEVDDDQLPFSKAADVYAFGY